MNKNFYDFKVKKIDGTQIELSQFKGNVLLVVNVASECGLTPQYEALEKIFEKYKAKGFSVLGFPSNEFGAQEPGTNAEIQNFCTSKFGIKFPMFEKIVVKGEGQHPLYKYLTEIKPEAVLVDGNSFEKKLEGYGIFRQVKTDILWNFEKFLISKNGEVIARYAPEVTPEDIKLTSSIEKALAV